MGKTRTKLPFARLTAEQKRVIAAVRKLVRHVAPETEESVLWGVDCPIIDQTLAVV